MTGRLPCAGRRQPRCFFPFCFHGLRGFHVPRAERTEQGRAKQRSRGDRPSSPPTGASLAASPCPKTKQPQRYRPGLAQTLGGGDSGGESRRGTAGRDAGLEQQSYSIYFHPTFLAALLWAGRADAGALSAAGVLEGSPTGLSLRAWGPLPVVGGCRGTPWASASRVPAEHLCSPQGGFRRGEQRHAVSRAERRKPGAKKAQKHCPERSPEHRVCGWQSRPSARPPRGRGHEPAQGLRCKTVVTESQNHRITESQNSRGWKGPLWVI